MSGIQFTTPVVDSIKFEKKTGFVIANVEINVEIAIKKSTLISTENGAYLYGIKIDISGEQSPINLSLLISATFKIEAAEDEIKKIIEDKGTKILVSYARPIISDIIVRSGLAPFDLPYIEG
ncbi:MAG: hypothetical protein E7302_13425 [Butyrivibrio sp.]|nr:hypothetical protein [Butyrivibrio sp.]